MGTMGCIQFQRGATFKEHDCSMSSTNEISPLETAQLGVNRNRAVVADSGGWVSLSGQSIPRILTGNGNINVNVNSNANSFPVVVRPFANGNDRLPPININSNPIVPIDPRPTDIFVQPIGVTRYSPNYQFNSPSGISARPNIYSSG